MHSIVSLISTLKRIVNETYTSQENQIKNYFYKYIVDVESLLVRNSNSVTRLHRFYHYRETISNKP